MEENKKHHKEEKKAPAATLAVFEYLDKIRLRGNMRQVYIAKYGDELKTEHEWRKLIK